MAISAVIRLLLSLETTEIPSEGNLVELHFKISSQVEENQDSDVFIILYLRL